MEALRQWFRRARYFLGSLARLSAIRRSVADLEAANAQLTSVVEELGGILPPPKHLQERVVGVYAPDFVSSGRGQVAELDAVLAEVGASLASFPRVLDFGCGCGRVLRAASRLGEPGQSYHGSDVDAEAIAWCREHYSSFAEFYANPANPPTEYASDFFDCIYSISIFTHLPESMQFAWLEELARILRPGGYLLASIHGESHYDKIPTGDGGRQLRARGFAYANVGDTDGLPEFYQAAFHTHEYVREHWSKTFEIVAIRTLAVGGHQDLVLCRKPA